MIIPGMNKTLVIIVGPTGIGKTDVTINLAFHFHSEIISADSRQFYKELKIGTAVPSEEQLQKVKHHLIQHKSIFDYYNAFIFEQEVLSILAQLFLKHDIVFLTGGSGLYINAVCNGIDDIPDVDINLRKSLIEKLEQEGIESLQSMLQKMDPKSYQTIDINNTKRILKALEITIQSGKPYSSFLIRKIKKRDFNIIKIGLNTDRTKLYEKINLRTDIMIKNGLENETKQLFPIFKKEKINALNTVGYKEFFNYFDHLQSKEKAIELIKQNTRHYAKRQLTWFNKDKEINWFEPNEIDQILHLINSVFILNNN